MGAGLRDVRKRIPSVGLSLPSSAVEISLEDRAEPGEGLSIRLRKPARTVYALESISGTRSRFGGVIPAEWHRVFAVGAESFAAFPLPAEPERS